MQEVGLLLEPAMTGQRWRTYALILQIYVLMQAMSKCLDYLGPTWGVIAATCLIPLALLGLAIPITPDRTVGRHRTEE